jgi:hypothetical protein
LPLAAAAAAIIFYALTDSVQRQMIEPYGEADVVRQTAISTLAADLGGDVAARVQAEQVIAMIETAQLADAESAPDTRGEAVARE